MRAWNTLCSIVTALRGGNTKSASERTVRRRLHLEALEARQMLAILFVDDNFANPVIGQDPDGAGPAANFGTDSFATIQAAINAASASGDTVSVYPGTYAENLLIPNKTLTLQGAQAGVDARGRIVGSPNPATESIVAPAAGRALELQGNPGGVIVDGFAFSGSLNGATGVIESTTGTTNGLQLLNNYVEVASGFNASALFLNKSASDATIDRNVFVAAAGSSQSVIFDGADQFHGLYFTNNDVLRTGAVSGTGLFVDGNRNIGTSVSLRTPLFQGNLFQGHALGFNAGQRSFANAQFVENTFTGNVGGMAGGPLNSTIARNSFTANSLYGLRLTAFGNTADATRGAQNTTVTNNVFSGNGTTVDLVNGYGDIRIEDQFNGTQSTNTISNNSLGSTVAVFNLEINAEVVNVSGNWFGTTTEASVIAKVLGPAAANVDVSPYLGSGTDTDLVTPGFQGGTASLFVTSQLSQAGATGRIQEAVNLAASVATITVGAGSYAENVILPNKSLSLYGAKAGVDARGRVVGAPSPATESVIAPVAGRPIELQGNPGGVVIDGFAVVGSLNGATGVIESTTGTTNGLQLLNNYVQVVTGFSASALFLNKSAIDATLDRNVFIASDVSSQAILLDGPDQFHGLYFTNNDVLRTGAVSGTGLFVDGNRNIGTSVSLRTPLFQGNLFQGHALGFNAGQRSFANAQFVENTFTNNTGGFAGGPLNSSIARNSFTTNSLYGLRLTAFGNTADATRGAQNTTVTNNVFSGNGTTVDLVNGYGDIRIDDQFNGTQSTNTISNNSLGSTVAVFNRETNAEVVNVSGNWFGTTTEASVIAKVLGPAAANVDVSPYLGSGTDTDLVTPGFQGGTASLFVTSQLSQAGATGRITEAVNLAASVAAITVHGGTYSGNVTPSTKAIAFTIGESTALVTINGDLTLDANDSLALDINGTVAGTGYDQVAVNGVVTLGNSVLTTTTGFTPAAGDTFRLIDNDLVDAVSGTFFGLAGGSKFVSSGKTFYIHYSGAVAGDGNDVTLRVNLVPTTSGIANVEVAEDAANSVIDLFPSFADVEDLDPALVYTITGNTNPVLFSSLSINNTTGEFTLDYAADLNSPANGGPATITVRATDTDGDYVETSFVVTVTEVNDTPTGVNDTIPFYIGPGTRTIAHATLLANDIRGPLNENPQTLTLIAVGSALPVGATVSISGSNVLYTPPLGYSGPASFVYTLEDNGTTNGVANPLTSTATANLFFLFPGVAVPQVDLNGPLANFGNAVTYTENTPAVNLTTNTATVTDSDSTYLLSITATLLAAPNGVDEVLSAVTTGTSITASYNSANGVLTLMGPDTATNFQQVLRTVAYQNLSEDPKTQARTVRFVASDGANLSSFRDATISIVAVADAPSSSGTTTGLTYVENAGNLVVFPDIVANDPDSSYFIGSSYSYGLTKATISISPYFADQDRLNYTNVGIGGSFNTTTGVFTLNGTQTLAKYNDALRLITYQNLSDNPNTTPRTISVVVFDSTSSSAPLSRVISITSVNDAPLVDLNGPAATGGNYAVTYRTSGSPVALSYSTSTLTDADNANLTSLTVTITNPQNGANEVILYTLPGGISASAPSGAAGTVVFTGSATTATYQTLMRSIQYRNLAGSPTLSPARLVTFAANDGTGTPTAIGTSTATVTLASPLVASGSPTSIDTTRLTRSQLTSIVTAAITRWSDLGLNAGQLATLRNTSYVIADFGATNLLGTAASGQVITLDDNAAGFGWFVDGSPLTDEEFPIEVSHSERRAPGMTKMDLLTVLMHEMGHILGLPDIDDHDSSGVMTDALDAGTRRLCTEEDLAMLAFYLAQNSSTTNVASYDADTIRAEVFSRWSA